MISNWKVLFRLHNIAKIPPSVCVESGDERVFTVVARALAPDGSFFPGCAEVQASFTPRDVLRPPPVPAGSPDVTVLEVKLDESSERCAAAAAEWTFAVPAIDVLLTLREWRGVDSVTRVLGPVSRLHIDVADVVRRRKLVTHVVGTVIGQLGVSIAVAPSDEAGYRQRLSEFLTQHNPGGLALVESVVSSIGEIDTFTRLYRKYGVVDYARRMEDFFRVYGREHMSQIPSLLLEWENREEELVHNLVLDNGPEPDNIDTNTRLNAFMREYGISPSAVDVARIIKDMGDKPHELFMALTAKYGPEPDPRGYLFLPIQYDSTSVSASTAEPQNGGIHNDRKHTNWIHANETDLENLPALMQSSLQVYANNIKSFPQEVQLDHSLYDTQQGGLRHRPQARPFASSYSSERLLPASSTKNPVETNANRAVTTATGDHNSEDPLWANFCDALNHIGHSLSDVYYMQEGIFVSLVKALGYTAAERDALLLQWQRRIRAAVQEESLLPGDASYDTAMTEIVNAVGLHPLNLNALSVISVRNCKHDTRFSARLLTAKARTTERLALVGEYNRLRAIITYGVGNGHPMAHADTNDPVQVSNYHHYDHHNSHDNSDNNNNKHENSSGMNDAGACGVPVAVFHRQPFRNWSRKQPTCILVCDVIVGAPFISAPLTKAACAATPDFRARYDSCVFDDAGGGQAVAVYDAAQVLPRYLVQCHVDTSAMPCPAHPTRAVEYFVPETHSFACSRCVVLGSHRGADVITVDDAAAKARASLADHQRAAAQYVLSLDAALAEMAQEECAIRTAPRRAAAEREIERIRLEAEERIRAINHALQQDEAELHADIARRREQSHRARKAAEAFAENVSAALQLTAPHDIVDALQRISTADELRHIQQRQQEPTQQHQDQPLWVLSAQDLNQRQRQAVSQSEGQRQNQSQQHQGADGRGPLQVVAKDSRRQSLYQKYLAITEANNIITNPNTNNNRENRNNNNNANNSRASSTAYALTTHSIELSPASRHAKEDVTRGWALFRQGEVEAARKVWESVYRCHPNDAVGARVQAYIAEAIERDYGSAAAWYDVALQRDPCDALTMYNYGVLLEALLGRRQEALVLFDRASELGDTTASRRAQQLRAMMQ